jgi:hypothetical protein
MISVTNAYLHDTWGPLKYAARWCFSASRIALWPEEAIHRLYRALEDDGRVRAVRIESGDFRAGDVLDLVSHERAIPVGEAVAHALAFSGEIGTLALELELRAYVRKVVGGPPQLAWVGEGTEATLMPAAPPLAAEACLHLWSTLFRPRSPDGLDNDELYRLNAPILTRLIHRLDKELGSLAEFEGAGVCETGFVPYGPDVYG